MKTINSEIGLLNVVKKNSVVIYGAGAVGKALLTYILLHDMAYQELNVVVSESPKEQELEGIPVYNISEASVKWDQAVTIIAAMETKKYEMSENAKNYCAQIYILEDDFCMHLRHLAGDNSYGWTWAQKKYGIASLVTRQEFVALHDAMIRMTPQPTLQYLVLNILDHCNLNCKGCDHFAPIAKKEKFLTKL